MRNNWTYGVIWSAIHGDLVMLEVRTAGPSPRTVAADCAPCWMIAPHIPMRFEVKIMPAQYEMARTG